MGNHDQETKLVSGVYKQSELEKIFGSRTSVQRKLKASQINKISRGFYSTPDMPYNQAFFAVIKKFYPQGVISKKTLLYHFKLTTDQPDTMDLDVKQNSRLRKSTDLFNLYRTNKIFSTHLSEFNSIKLKCYSVERALFEVLYYEKNPGHLTTEVINNYFANYQYKPVIIFKIAQRFNQRGFQLAKIIQIIAGNK